MSDLFPELRVSRDPIGKIYTATSRIEKEGEVPWKSYRNEITVTLKVPRYIEEVGVTIRKCDSTWDGTEEGRCKECTECEVNIDLELNMGYREVIMLIAALQDVIAQADQSEEEWLETQHKMMREGRL